MRAIFVGLLVFVAVSLIAIGALGVLHR